MSPSTGVPPASEGSSWIRRRGRVDAPLLVTALPSEAAFGFVGRLLPTSSGGELRLQLHRLPPPDAMELLHAADLGASTELESGTTVRGARPARLRVEAAAAAELAESVAARVQDLWRVGLSLHAVDRRPVVAERLRRDLARRAAALGLRTRPPEFDTARVVRPPEFPPADGRPMGYWHLLATEGAAAFFPFVDESIAEEGGVLVGLLLDDAAPVVVNRWSHGSYSWGVFGTTGAGKTFAAALWALRTRWMTPGLSLTFIDPLGEFTRLGPLLGGDVVTVGPEERGRVNPLDPATTGEDRRAKTVHLVAMMRALFPSLTDEESAVLESSLDGLYQRGRDRTPTFRDLAEAVARAPGLSPNRLATFLELFRSGPLRHLDGPTTVDLTANPLVVNLVDAEPSHLPFHLAYLLDAVYGRLRSTPGPKLVVVDEAHLLTRHPATTEFLDRIVRHVRHFEAGLLLLSQNPDDFLTSSTGRSLLRNLSATVLLRLPEVSSETRSFFQLTEVEAEWLPRARLPAEAGYAEGLLRFGPSHLPIAVVASTPEFDLLAGALRTRPPVRAKDPAASAVPDTR
ncbi:MAG: hypothetical protein L3K15_04110 [Thermoplasmata archaeon]|nr:hypothetical protein [Thermoplasmata archaeon]